MASDRAVRSGRGLTPILNSDRVPDYGNQGLIPTIIALSAIFTALSLTAVGVRFYSRARYTKIAFEEGLAVLAWILGALTTFALVWLTQLGVGMDFWNIHPDTLRVKFKDFSGAVALSAASHVAAVTVIKVSIILLYIRLYPFGAFKRWCYMALFFIAGTGISLTLATIFACNPVSAQWTMDKRGAKCIKVSVMYEAGAVLLAFGDVLTLLLPFPMIYKSTMPSKRKVHVAAVFSVGLIATICSILRAYFTFLLRDTSNLTMSIAKLNMTAMTEVHLGLICSCAPAIKGLLGRKFEFFRESSPSVVNADHSSVTSARRYSQSDNYGRDDGNSLKVWGEAELVSTQGSNHELVPRSLTSQGPSRC